MESEGTVILRARAGVASFGNHEAEAAVLEVVDNGVGILPEVEKRLFDPFFTTKEAGTGLGLPIAARIVEKHGGMVQYHTRPGYGTTFGIVLPRQNKETSDSAKCAENSAD
jgi:signal transduction histidine kinase